MNDHNAKVIQGILLNTIINTFSDTSDKPLKTKILNATLKSIPDILQLDLSDMKNKANTYFEQPVVRKEGKIIIAKFVDESKNVWE